MNPVPVYCIVAACAAVFFNTLPNAFHLDDFYRIVDNPGVEEFWPPWRHFVDPTTSCTLPRIVQYRPLLPLSLSVNHLFFGDSLTAYHAVNLIFHCLASVFVYGVAREVLERREGPAAMAGLCFAVHPVSGITVNYLCSRDLGLMQMFLFASLWIYLRMRRRGFSLGMWIACLICYCLALLSKTNAAMLPMVIYLYEVTMGRARPWSMRALLRPVPFGLCALCLFGFTKYYLNFSDYEMVVESSGHLTYGAAQLQHHVFHYLSNFPWPYPIRQDPGIEIVVWKRAIGAACLLASWLAAFAWWRRWPLFAFCVLAYQVMLVPTSTLLPLWADAVAYRPYSASAFLFLGLAALLFCRPWIGAVLSFGLFGHFAWASVELNRTWKDGESLWQHSVSYGGGALAHLNLALNTADPARRRSLLEQALVLNPDYLLARMHLGQEEIRAGEPEAGITRVREAVAASPKVAQYQYMLALAEHQVGNADRAAAAAVLAARLAPAVIKYRYLAGWYLQLASQDAESLPHLQFVLARRPEYQEAQFLAGYALQMAGEGAAAVALYESFVGRWPKHDRAWYNLGYARMKAGAFAAAIEAFDACLAANAKNRNAHLHLSTCYGKIGNVNKAVQHKKLYEGSKSP